MTPSHISLLINIMVDQDYNPEPDNPLANEPQEFSRLIEWVDHLCYSLECGDGKGLLNLPIKLKAYEMINTPFGFSFYFDQTTMYTFPNSGKKIQHWTNPVCKNPKWSNNNE